MSSPDIELLSTSRISLPHLGQSVGDGGDPGSGGGSMRKSPAAQ
jgi:hypothetical protein